MREIADASSSVSVWLLVSFAWGAFVFACSRLAGGAAKHEGWPAYWLAWQVVAVVPPLFAPFLAASSAPIPMFELDSVAVVAALGQTPVRAGAPDAGLTLLQIALIMVSALYAGGVVAVGARFAFGFVRTLRLTRAARPLQLEGLALRGRGCARVLVSEESASCFCVGGTRPAIVLSRRVIAKVTREQLQMIVTHEAWHLRRRDPLLFIVLELTDVVFWFNPLVRALSARVRLAAEIACDAGVLDGGGGQRKSYADALVRGLDAASSVAMRGVTAFGRRADGPRIRLFHILRGAAAKRPVWISGTVLGAAIAVGLAGATFAASAVRGAALVDPDFAMTIDGRVSQPFGFNAELHSFHNGVDVAVPIGTPVRAPAPGEVVYAGNNFQGEAHWGNVVVLRHARRWVSFFAHLDKTSVAVGESVAAGGIIGIVGNTGVSTGPHVHVELLRDGTRVDPHAFRVTP